MFAQNQREIEMGKFVEYCKIALYRIFYKCTYFTMKWVNSSQTEELTGYKPFEHEYNCGFKNKRMSERAIEIPIMREFVEKYSSDIDNIVEVGAVSPYYFPDYIHTVIDPYDSHPQVTKKDLFDCDFTDRIVVSVSTIEHVGTGEYGVEIRQDAVTALKKILDESKHCLITWPVDANHALDSYAYENEELHKYCRCYARGKFTNNWRKIDIGDILSYKYGKICGACAILVLEM